MIIRPITQNAMDKKFSIRQFPSPEAEHPYIVFPQKNLAVGLLDISRFTFCKVDYKWEIYLKAKIGSENQ